MKAIIPAKSCSTRVPNKNYRPFFRGRSLVDVLIEKLVGVLPPADIYLSCEDEAKESVADAHGIQFIARDPVLARNDTSIAEYFQGVAASVPGNDDILWCQVTNPLFDRYQDVVDEWNGATGDYDSLVVVHPTKDYLLDDRHQPIGFGFGPWHKISQKLPTLYRLPFVCSVLTRDCIARCGYYVGSRPMWFEAEGANVDIDTEEEFAMAQLMYERAVA